MANKDLDPNLEWKKSGFETSEKVTLKVNLNEAMKYEASKKSNPQKNKAPTPADLPAGLNKIRKKIKDVFDEEDDEDEFQVKAPIMMPEENSSLLNALNDDEKRILKQQEINDNMKMQQNAGKLEALSIAAQFAKEAGLKKVDKKSAAKGIANNDPTANVLKDIVKDDVLKKLNIKGKELSDGKVIQLLRGIKRIRAVGGEDAIKGLKISEVVQAGEKEVTDDKKVARVIQKKRGLGKEEKKRLEKTKGKNKTRNTSKVLVQKKSITYDLFNFRD